ncbi:MAG: hypothetical protein OXD43_01215 [Bacteroidetes bacterium]|nr:hypothetical protein [Bacteroidota bacterium]
MHQAREAIDQMKEEVLRRQILIYEDVVTNGRAVEEVAGEWDVSLQQLQSAVWAEADVREKEGHITFSMSGLQR